MSNTELDAQFMELIEIITEWHTNKLQDLQTILDAPDGTDIIFRDCDGQDLVIAGNSKMVKGFRIGIALAKVRFEKLPFSIQAPEAGGEV